MTRSEYLRSWQEAVTNEISLLMVSAQAEMTSVSEDFAKQNSGRVLDMHSSMMDLSDF